MRCSMAAAWISARRGWAVLAASAWLMIGGGAVGFAGAAVQGPGKTSDSVGAVAHAATRRATGVGAASYTALAAGPWRVRRWSGQRFIFDCLGGPLVYGPGRRIMPRVEREFLGQHLLTPTHFLTRTDAKIHYPIESKAWEWDVFGASAMAQYAALFSTGHFKQPLTLVLRGESISYPPPDTKHLTRKECYNVWRRTYLALAGKPLYSKAVPGGRSPGREHMCSECDRSCYSVYAAQWGCRMLTIELGEDIIASQTKIAFARGAARQNGIPLMADVSAWQMDTRPVYRVGENQYTPHGPGAVSAAKLWPGGRFRFNGGHSPSLLARLWYVCWLSGFAVVSPEDAPCNFFSYDAADRGRYVNSTIFVLKSVQQRAKRSPIGRQAQRFLAVARRHPHRGIPYTPFAVMLDKFSGFGGGMGSRSAMSGMRSVPWGVLPPDLGDREIQLFFDTVFPSSMELQDVVPQNEPNESHLLVADPYGDSFDVLLSNASQRTLDSYPVVILLGDIHFSPVVVRRLTRFVRQGGVLCISYAQQRALGAAWRQIQGAGEVKRYGFHGTHQAPAHPNTARWTDAMAAGTSPAAVAKAKAQRKFKPYERYFQRQVRTMLKPLAGKYLPVRVTGHVEYLINRTADGWVVGLVNDSGIAKRPDQPVHLDANHWQSVRLTLKQGRLAGATEWTQQMKVAIHGNGVRLRVPPGGVRIVHLVTRPGGSSKRASSG